MSQTALADLCAAQAPAARRLAYLLTGDTQLAEDIVQDCFVKMASRLRRVDDPGPYLRRMVVNASHSHHRRLRVRRDRARDEAMALGADSDTTPDGADRRAERARLRQALDALPPRQRSAVVLRHWLDLSEQQCADELGCSVGTVKSLASRGLLAGGEMATPDCGPGSSTVQHQGLFLRLQGGAFVGWTTGTPGLTTAEGIGVGSTLAALREAVPGVTVAEGTVGTEWSTPGGLAGFLDGTADRSVISSMGAGAQCVFR